MPTVTILELAILVATGVIAACVLYQARKMRQAYTEQRAEFIRAIAAAKDCQSLHSQMAVLIQKREPSNNDPREVVHKNSEVVHKTAEVEANHSQNGWALMRKGVLSRDAPLRFSVLKDWVGKNSLAMIRRAEQDVKTPNDLIAMIPAVLEAEAVLVDERVLLISTRGHSEKFSLRLQEADESPANGPDGSGENIHVSNAVQPRSDVGT
jgi:hypothetical protein